VILWRTRFGRVALGARHLAFDRYDQVVIDGACSSSSSS
jgi:hypothetical protein